MKTIIVADIHGLSAPLRALWAPLAADAVFVSPWDGEGCPYASESEAHAAFIAGDGIAAYAAKIAAATAGEPAFIVAFSVGASAAWLHAASDRANPLSVATLFYGSRIRDYASLTPRFSVHAIFAQREASFSAAELASRIAGGRVCCDIEGGTAHGFMNPCSPQFAADRCAGHLQRLAADLARRSRQQAAPSR
jgi:hypothetical protein